MAPSPAATLALSAYSQKLGIVQVEVNDDRALYAMPFHTDNTTVGDVVHGGAILSLADIAATAAAWSTVTDASAYRGITIDVAHAFMSAARSADLLADARVTKRGGTVCFVDVEIRNNSTAELVGRTKVVYKLSRIQTPQQQLNGLFRDKNVDEQMQLLAMLEHAGAALYRQFADATAEPLQKAELLQAAEREIENASTLQRVLTAPK